MDFTGNFILDLLRNAPRQEEPVQQPEPDFNPFSNAPQSPVSDFTPQKGGYNILNSLGQITGLGSPLWGHGLDIDLKKGDPVSNAFSGVVDFVGNRGGFGKQVRVKGDDGREYWYSHLDMPEVKTGQRVGAGQRLGLGGNTGNVIPGPGGDGSHLDLTVLEGGKYLPPSLIAQMLRGMG